MQLQKKYINKIQYINKIHSGFNMAGPVVQLRANQLNTANIAAIDILFKRLS